MTEQRLANLLGDDDDELDTGLIEPLDDAVAGSTGHEVDVAETIITAEPPAQPLRLPARLLNDPPDTQAALALQQLRGHRLSVDWLPEGLSDPLDQIRLRHLDLLRQLGERLTAVRDLERQFRREDHEHEQAVRQALRDGGEDPSQSA